MEATLDRESARGQLLRRLRLTEAWTPLIPHAMQAAYYWSPVRFKVNPSGRRSGKTELAKRKGVRELVKRRDRPARLLYGAPTWGQAHDIFWKDFVGDGARPGLIPPHWIASIRKTDMEVMTHWGAMLRIMGMDRPRRLEGVPWNWICVDEIADCPSGAYKLNIRPALATLGMEGGADLIGVPDEHGRNQTEYEELWDIGVNWDPDPKVAVDPDVCSFHWSATEILAPAEIAALARSHDLLAFRQEIGGQFVRSGGKACPTFNPRDHVREGIYTAYCPLLPLDLTFDFGSKVAAALVCQSFRGRSWVVAELVSETSSTVVACEQFLTEAMRRGWNIRRGIRLFGDAAGATRHSNTGETDYEIIALKFRGLNIEWMQMTAAPLVKDTLNVVRLKLVDAMNFVRLHIHPSAVRLISDLKNAPWPSDLREYHCFAALRYYLYRLYADLAGASGFSVTSAEGLLPKVGGQLLTAAGTIAVNPDTGVPYHG